MNRVHAFLVVIAVISAIFIGVFALQFSHTGQLANYYKGIDVSCQTDSDCEIKDVRSCCGYYPQCVNRDAVINTKLVDDICSTGQLVRACGDPDTGACQCIKGKCDSKR